MSRRFIFEDLAQKVESYFDVERGKTHINDTTWWFRDAILRQDIGPFPEGMRADSVDIGLNTGTDVRDISVDIMFTNPRIDGEIFIPNGIKEYAGDPEDPDNEPVLINATEFFDIKISVKPAIRKTKLH
jgi:hypothetical protein